MRTNQLLVLNAIAALCVLSQAYATTQDETATVGANAGLINVSGCKSGSACVTPGGGTERAATTDSQDVIVGQVRRQADVRNGFGSKACMVAGASECVAPMAGDITVIPYPQVSFPTISWGASGGALATWGSVNAASLTMVCGNVNGNVFSGAIVAGASNAPVAGSTAWPGGTYVCTITATNSVGRQVSASQTVTVPATAVAVLPTVNFTNYDWRLKTPANGLYPAYVTISWSIQDATSATLDCNFRGLQRYTGSIPLTGVNVLVPLSDTSYGRLGYGSCKITAVNGTSRAVVRNQYRWEPYPLLPNMGSLGLYTDPLRFDKNGLVQLTTLVVPSAQPLSETITSRAICRATSNGAVIVNRLLDGNGASGDFFIGDTHAPVGSTGSYGVAGWPVDTQVTCSVTATSSLGGSVTTDQTLTAVSGSFATSIDACNASPGCNDPTRTDVYTFSSGLHTSPSSLPLTSSPAAPN